VAARLPAPRRRRQLLDVARTVFAERGFHPTSMNDIAEAAGVTKPVLYQHFRSKRQLYLVLLDDVGGQLLSAIGEATSKASGPREQVEAGFRAYFRFVVEQEDSFRVLFGGGTRRDEEFSEKVRQVEETIAEAIAVLIEVQGLDTESRRLLAHGLVGLAEGTSRHWLAGGLQGDPDAHAALLGDLAWAGLRGLAPRSPVP
jgi:AcrR family transcriptional regulator